jgi:GAF domain-containing protein
LIDKFHPVSKESKTTENVKEKVQGRVVHGSGLLQKLNTIHDVASKFDNTKSREEILKILRSEAKWLLTYDVCFISLLNQTRTHYAFYSLSPIADASDLDHKHFLIDEGIPGWVVKNQASFIGDIESAPKFSHAIEGRLQELGIRSILVVPLKTGNEVVGTLTFGSLKLHLYNEEDAAIAQLIGLYVATSLKDASIFEDTRKRIIQIELINNISQHMSSTLQLDELLKTAASMVQKTFNYFDVTVFLRTDDNSFVELAAHSGSFVDFLPHRHRINRLGFQEWRENFMQRCAARRALSCIRIPQHAIRINCSNNDRKRSCWCFEY